MGMTNIVFTCTASSLSIDLDKHKSCHCTWEPPNILTQCCASIPIKGYFSERLFSFSSNEQKRQRKIPKDYL